MFYKHWLGGVTYTEGVREMAKSKSAWWLVDAIASHVVCNQFKTICLKNERFRDMQIWILRKMDSGAELIAVVDVTPHLLKTPIIKQVIEYTDFPFNHSGRYKLYCARNMTEDGKSYYTILEPSEY
jgi:hypothetical protein